MPVFFDTVFYLMLPLAKVFTARSGGNYLLLVLAIVAGGSMAHACPTNMDHSCRGLQ